MSNQPFNISTASLSAPVAEAVAVIVAALASKPGDSNAIAGVQSLSEAVEKLRTIGA